MSSCRTDKVSKFYKILKLKPKNICFIREVQIYKFISIDSIDETMIKIQNRKIELGENLTSEDNGNLF